MQGADDALKGKSTTIKTLSSSMSRNDVAQRRAGIGSLSDYQPPPSSVHPKRSTKSAIDEADNRGRLSQATGVQPLTNQLGGFAPMKTRDNAKPKPSVPAHENNGNPLRPVTPSRSLPLIGTPTSLTDSPCSALSSTHTPTSSPANLFSSVESLRAPRCPNLSGSSAGKLSNMPAAVQYERTGVDDHEILHLKPTEAQWRDFPNILKLARDLGASEDGCFKVTLPQQSYEALPHRDGRIAKGHAYKIKQIKRNSFWRVTTVPAEGVFNQTAPKAGTEVEDVHQAIGKLKKMFSKNNGKRLRQVLYRVDVPAWTSEQRLEAGVPQESPIHPLLGDKLEQTRAIIPGIHTPYVYESAVSFGATFQVHAEDYRLVSLNHLYKGRKIWIVVPSTEIKKAELAWKRKQNCSQFMRHRAEFFFPEKLDKLGIPYRIVDQHPGETIVILPDAYHEGFSTGYTLAEAKNYADPEWSTDNYQACDESCRLLTAIPARYMTLLREGEERIDLCATYNVDVNMVDEDVEGEELSEEENHRHLSQQPTPTPSPGSGDPKELGFHGAASSEAQAMGHHRLKRKCVDDNTRRELQMNDIKRVKLF